MKFAKYLESDAVAEWNRAYIDYRGLKKHLKILKAASTAGTSQSRRSLTGSLTGAAHFFGSDDGRAPASHASPTAKPIPPAIKDLYRNNDVGELAADERRAIVAALLEGGLLEEVRFFDLLDCELDNINKFYILKETEISLKMQRIEDQFRTFSQHRAPPSPANDQTPFFATTARAILGRFRNAPSSNLKTLSGKASHKAISPSLPSHISHPSHAAPSTTSIPIPGPDSGSDDNAPTHEPVHTDPPLIGEPIVSRRLELTSLDEKKVKAKLKKALLEIYRSLELLKNFRILNHTGFTKILKKFDKTSGRATSEYFLKYVASTYFYTSPVLNALFSESEELFLALVGSEAKSRAAALQELKLPDARTMTFHSTSGRIGFYLGLSIPPIVYTLDLVFRRDRLNTVPHARILLQLFGGFTIPIFLLFLYGINILVWTRYKINYVFIFELDPRDNLSYHQFSELGGIFLLVWSYLFFLTFSNYFDALIEYTSYPAILFVAVVLLAFCPFNIMYRNSRGWFLNVLRRIVTTPYYSVEFRDFFVTDELCSMSYVFICLFLWGCSYSHGFANVEKSCDITHSWAVPFFAALPLYWRMMQCFRRFYDSRYSIHLINAGKYFSTLVAVFAAAAWRNSPEPFYEALWILTAITATCYTFSWDTVQDWGLLRRLPKKSRRKLREETWSAVLKRAKTYRFLRPEISYAPDFYYGAIALNLLLRCSWIIGYAITAWASLDTTLALFVLAAAEIFRRFVWNLIRLENEHLNNCGRFRASRDVPLPFAHNEPSDDEDNNPEMFVPQASSAVFDAGGFSDNLEKFGPGPNPSSSGGDIGSGGAKAKSASGLPALSSTEREALELAAIRNRVSGTSAFAHTSRNTLEYVASTRFALGLAAPRGERGGVGVLKARELMVAPSNPSKNDTAARDESPIQPRASPPTGHSLSQTSPRSPLILSSSPTSVRSVHSRPPPAPQAPSLSQSLSSSPPKFMSALDHAE